MFRRRLVLRAIGAFAALSATAGLVGCGDDSSGPDAADSCQELVDEAADVARSLAEEFAGATVESLDPGTPDDPFPQLSEPFVPFRERAAELGCDQGELRRLACDAYKGIEPTGPAIEELLAAIHDVCS